MLMGSTTNPHTAALQDRRNRTTGDSVTNVMGCSSCPRTPTASVRQAAITMPLPRAIAWIGSETSATVRRFAGRPKSRSGLPTDQQLVMKKIQDLVNKTRCVVNHAGIEVRQSPQHQ